MTDCVFCGIVDGQIPADVVYQDDDVTAFRDISPSAQVHVLVIPREHYRTVAEVGQQNAALAGRLLQVVGDVAAGEGVAETGYRVISNVGADSGQEVDHAHIHVLGGQRLGPLVTPTA